MSTHWGCARTVPRGGFRLREGLEAAGQGPKPAASAGSRNRSAGREPQPPPFHFCVGLFYNPFSGLFNCFAELSTPHPSSRRLRRAPGPHPRVTPCPAQHPRPLTPGPSRPTCPPSLSCRSARSRRRTPEWTPTPGLLMTQQRPPWRAPPRRFVTFRRSSPFLCLRRPLDACGTPLRDGKSARSAGAAERTGSKPPSRTGTAGRLRFAAWTGAPLGTARLAGEVHPGAA